MEKGEVILGSRKVYNALKGSVLEISSDFWSQVDSGQCLEVDIGFKSQPHYLKFWIIYLTGIYLLKIGIISILDNYWRIK